MKDIIKDFGFNAGKVWKTLESHGEVNPAVGSVPAAQVLVHGGPAVVVERHQLQKDVGQSVGRRPLAAVYRRRC